MESSFSVPRPRRRDSSVASSGDGGEINTKRAERLVSFICLTP
jgi:hypothetical protein